MERIKLITFSPTGTSHKVGLAIAEGMGADEVQTLDLAHAEWSEGECLEGLPVVMTVPVYGGRVAPLALQRMEGLRGADTPAVLVVVYGNRHYEGALVQLADFVRERGFRVVGAATFVGEHSFSTAECPVAAGRPDVADLEDARAFGRGLAQKLEAQEGVAEVDVATIGLPQQDAEVMQRFKQTIASWRAEGKPMPVCPTVVDDCCTQCGQCAELCPTGAISAEQPATTDASRCIKCCACVKGCPTGARVFDTPFSALLAENFAERKANITLL